MMKYILFLFFLLCGSTMCAQSIYTTFKTSPQYYYIKGDSGLAVPLRDTSTGRGTTQPGSIVCRPADSLFYGWNGRKWAVMGADVSSLVALINTKVDSVTSNGDTLYYWKQGVGYGTVFTAMTIGDSAQYVTWKHLQHSIDSLSALKKNANDSTGVRGFTTLAQLNKTRDSLLALISSVSLNLQQVTDNGNTTTDSINVISDNVGVTGDDPGRRLVTLANVNQGMAGNIGQITLAQNSSVTKLVIQDNDIYVQGASHTQHFFINSAYSSNMTLPQLNDAANHYLLTTVNGSSANNQGAVTIPVGASDSTVQAKVDSVGALIPNCGVDSTTLADSMAVARQKSIDDSVVLARRNPITAIVDEGLPDSPTSGSSTYTNTKLIGLPNRIQIVYAEMILSDFGNNSSFTFNNSTGTIDISPNTFTTATTLYINLNQ